MNMNELGKKARQAARLLATATTDQKRRALFRLAELLELSSDEILLANQQDLSAAAASGLSPALLDRLMLNPSRLGGIAADLRSLADLDDPIGEISEEKSLPNGLKIHKQRVPLGVVGVIYEARPNVTIDVAGIAILTANAAILRGGSETIRSNQALVRLARQALEQTGLPVDAIQLIADPDRARVLEMLHLYEFIDLIIPRGGAGLHQFCRENSRIPVITGGIGICHLFVDQSADLEACLPVIRNAKIQRPSVCNALDTLLIHRAVAGEFLPKVVERLEKDGVTFRADASALPFLESRQGLPGSVLPAGAQDFDTEWLSLVLGLKVVDGLDEAIEHIQAHSTAHSDGILTNSQENASRFVSLVDSSVVYVNASTRFTDGSQLGLGAEVAVSTQRLHARGPMGPTEMTSYKWVVRGEYHIRE
jgi:glutamate-5-semialdehyde dehydrogenase